MLGVARVRLSISFAPCNLQGCRSGVDTRPVNVSSAQDSPSGRFGYERRVDARQIYGSSTKSEDYRDHRSWSGTGRCLITWPAQYALTSVGAARGTIGPAKAILRGPQPGEAAAAIAGKEFSDAGSLHVLLSVVAAADGAGK